MLGIFYLFGIGILTIIGLWTTLEKAGKPGWASLIPIYNGLVVLDVVGKPRIWIVLLIIPVVNIIFSIWIVNLLSMSFGKGIGFTVGILLLPFIFLLILGLGSSKYLGPAGKPFVEDQINSIGSSRPEGQRYMK